jgi:uncharacterized membrane protein YjjB (DUF3815 family)
MGLFGEMLHHTSHAFQEKPFSTLFTSMAIGCSDKFLSLWYGKSSEEARKNQP